MNADINTLYTSEFYKIIDFKCKCKNNCVSGKEFSKSFNISFIRKGNFIYKVFRNNFDAYTGFALIDKPYSEHLVEHCHHTPDECTIIDFYDNFYNWLVGTGKLKPFFTNTDIQSLLIRTDNTVEYLHYLLLNLVRKRDSDKIQIDGLVMEILSWFLDRIDNRDRQFHLTLKFKQQHLPTVEKAKDYIFNNYYEDINLTDIACYCNISPFHFSRIFKTISNCTPYQFLLETRLTNAKQLIARNNDLPLKEVCYKSGFQSPEHFNAAFKKRFSYPPSYFKRCQKTQGF